MQVARLAPGIFLTQENDFLYAYLGQQRSCERLSLTQDGAQWEYLNVQFPDQIGSKYGFSTLAVWNHPILSSNNTDTTVLIFGGHSQQVFQWDITTTEVDFLWNVSSQEDEPVDLKSEDYFY